MAKVKTGDKVTVPGVGKGTVESHPRQIKGKEQVEVRTGPHTVILVPTKDL